MAGRKGGRMSGLDEYTVTIPVRITVMAKDRMRAQAMAGGLLIGSMGAGAERDGFDWAIAGNPVVARLAAPTTEER